MTTRMRKLIDASYNVSTSNCVGDATIATASECFEAAVKIFNAAGGVSRTGVPAHFRVRVALNLMPLNLMQCGRTS